MMDFALKHPTVWARQFTAGTVEEQSIFASQVGGKLKGVNLPPDKRSVHVLDEGEGWLFVTVVCVGDWVVKFVNSSLLLRVSDKHFQEVFEKCTLPFPHL